MKQKNITLADIKQNTTNNAGFDALRVKHATLSIQYGYDLQQRVNMFMAHPVIKQLQANKVIKVFWVGCNLYVIFKNDSMQSSNVHTAYVTAKADVQKTLDNILSSVFTHQVSDTFYMTHHAGAWALNEVITSRLAVAPSSKAVTTLLRQLSRVYKQAFIIGLDVFPNYIMDKFNNKYNKTLTTKEKKEKYNK